MGAADLDYGAARALMYVHNIDLDVLATAQLFGGDLVLAHHQAFVLVVKHERDGARLGVDAAHLGGNHLAHLVRKIFVDRVAFRFADALEDHLLGRLGGNAAKVVRRIGHADDVAHARSRHEPAGVSLQNLGARVHDVVHDLAFGEDTHVAAYTVHFGADIGD